VNILQKDHCVPCGFVSFETLEQAELCIATLHDQPNRDGTKNYVVRMADPNKSPGKDRINDAVLDNPRNSTGGARDGAGRGKRRTYNQAFDKSMSHGNFRNGTPPAKMSPNQGVVQSPFEVLSNFKMNVLLRIYELRNRVKFQNKFSCFHLLSRCNIIPRAKMLLAMLEIIYKFVVFKFCCNSIRNSDIQFCDVVFKRCLNVFMETFSTPFSKVKVITNVTFYGT
jgi:hypothetical protein